MMDGSLKPWKTSIPPVWQACALLAGGLFFHFAPEISFGIMLCMLFYAGERGELAGKLSREKFSFPFFKKTVKTFVLLQIGVMGLMLATQLILKLLDIDFEPEQAVMRRFRESGTAGRIALAVAVTTVIPLTEELFFRRLLFGCILPYTGTAAAAVIVSVIFGAAHGFAAGFPALCWIGLCFQWIYLKTGNFACPVLLHSMVNALSCAVTLMALR